MSTPYWMRVLPGGAPSVLEMGGEIDHSTAAKLQGRLLSLPTVDVVVDLSRVEFFGVGGLNLLLDAQARLADTGHTLSLAAAPHQVRRLIEKAGLAESLPCWATVDEARAAAAAAGRGTADDRGGDEPGTAPTPLTGETGCIGHGESAHHHMGETGL
jgi:anti-anti-sigma factor